MLGQGKKPNRRYNYKGERKMEKRRTNTRIEELMLSNRAINALKKAHIETIEQLMSQTEEELEKIPNLGRKSIMEIIEVINKKDEKYNSESDIDVLNLAYKGTKALKEAGINSIGQLLDCTEIELIDMDKIGLKTIKEVSDKLQMMGLQLRQIPKKDNDIARLNLSLRAYNALRRGGISKISQLSDINDLSKIKGIGERIAEEIKEKLKEYNK